MSLIIALAAMLAPVDANAVTAMQPAPSDNAQQTTTAPKATSTKTVSAKSKIICRQETPTGSIMPGKRICATAAQWREAEGG